MDIGRQFFGGAHELGANNLTGVGSLVSLFTRGILIFASILVLYFLVAAGIGMISGAGQDDPKKIEQARHTATSALIGFVVVFASYWIVKLVGEILGFPEII